MSPRWASSRTALGRLSCTGGDLGGEGGGEFERAALRQAQGDLVVRRSAGPRGSWGWCCRHGKPLLARTVTSSLASPGIITMPSAATLARACERPVYGVVLPPSATMTPAPRRRRRLRARRVWWYEVSGAQKGS